MKTITKVVESLYYIYSRRLRPGSTASKTVDNDRKMCQAFKSALLIDYLTALNSKRSLIGVLT